MNHEELSRRVAGELNYPFKTTAKVLSIILETILTALLEGDTVFLRKFGRFYTKKLGYRSGRERTGVFFRAQDSVAKRMQTRKGNRFYRVLAEDQLALARLTGKCPRCGRKLELHNLCTKCGQLPLKED